MSEKKQQPNTKNEQKLSSKEQKCLTAFGSKRNLSWRTAKARKRARDSNIPGDIVGRDIIALWIKCAGFC